MIVARTTAPKPKPELYRTVSADSGAPVLLSEACRRWLQRLGWPDKETHDLVAAVDEAVTNVVEHAYRAPALDQLHKLVWLDAAQTTHPSGQRRVTINVIDSGQWQPNPDRSGNGITRMRERTKALGINSGPTGTTVRLTSYALARRSRRGTAGSGAGGDIHRDAPRVPTPRRAGAEAHPPVTCAAGSRTT
jgi:hypothetical protein